MSDRSQMKSPLEIEDLILLHNAGASMEMIGNVALMNFKWVAQNEG
jgi:hypothetical protein